ncbi:unnamed protein product [Ilex paraguariensis]|uniref:Uncharacterized protein n=1 Tax=Ilex paraguariensis TaxID=185542 RepID=A0ABC8S670_9AQUA
MSFHKQQIGFAQDQFQRYLTTPYICFQRPHIPTFTSSSGIYPSPLALQNLNSPHVKIFNPFWYSFIYPIVHDLKVLRSPSHSNCLTSFLGFRYKRIYGFFMSFRSMLCNSQPLRAPKDLNPLSNFLNPAIYFYFFHLFFFVRCFSTCVSQGCRWGVLGFVSWVRLKATPVLNQPHSRDP